MATQALMRERPVVDTPRHLPARVPRAVAVVVAALLAVAAIARAGNLTSTRVTAVELSFVSLVAESLPFLLAGALLSSVLRGKTGRKLLVSAGRRPRLAAALAPLVGATLPLCDCGLLPIAREVRDNGGGRAVGAFLAGAPLTNPIVVISTLLAFPGDPGMAVGRVVCGLAMSMAVSAMVPPPPSENNCEQHQHGTPQHETPQADVGDGRFAPLIAELTRTAPTLILGALAAATLKAALPTGLLTSVASQPLLGALAMILLAFVMSICSQADAFVASTLPVGTLPRLAFLAVGPALDLRLATLYRREFGGRWVLRYAAVVVPTALIVAAALTTAGLR